MFHLYFKTHIVAFLVAHCIKQLIPKVIAFLSYQLLSNWSFLFMIAVYGCTITTEVIFMISQYKNLKKYFNIIDNTQL